MTSLPNLFDTFPEAIVLADQGKVIYCNDAAKALFAGINTPLKDDAPLPAPILDFWNTLDHNQPSAGALVLGGVRYEVTTQLEGQQILFLFRKKAATALTPELLTNFTNNLQEAITPLMYVSHLLTPTVEEAKEEKTAYYLSVLNQNCYRLTRIMRLVTTFRRFVYPQEGEEVLLSNVDIGLICQKVEEQVKPLLAMVKRTFRLDLVSGIHLVRGNAMELQRMLYQLISNGVKATEEGGEIALQMKVSSDMIYLTVKDDGKGIPDHMLGHIFSRFEEMQTLTDTTAGLGLGLTCVRQVADQCGGSVMLTSKEGEGTRVTIALPKQKRQDGAVYTPIQTTTEGMPTVLIELADALPAKAFLPKDLE